MCACVRACMYAYMRVYVMYVKPSSKVIFELLVLVHCLIRVKRNKYNMLRYIRIFYNIHALLSQLFLIGASKQTTFCCVENKLYIYIYFFFVLIILRLQMLS